MFLPELGKSLRGIGNPNSRICIVGDFTDGWDMQAGKPMSGPAGGLMENCLHNANLIRGECYITNLFKQKSNNPYAFYNDKKGTFTDLGMEAVQVLKEELDGIEANVFVAMGEAAFAALCDLDHLAMYRGYVFESSLLPGRKVIPTHHPRKALRGLYTYRYMIATDLKKVFEECKFPEIRRPERELIYEYGSAQDALFWLDYYTNKGFVGFDIEVLNYEISCISFASEWSRACVIPIANSWTIEEELAMWRGIQRVLGNPASVKVVQNGMFDIPFLLRQNGIVVRGPIHDTMVGHSIMYPELPKGLGFLGSIYCGAQEYWKDTVKFKSIKNED